MDTCQYKTIIESYALRVECEEHGTLTVQVPWAEKYGRESRLFESKAIDVMRQTSGKAAGDILGITWDEADGIKQQAVRRGLAKRELTGAEYVCVDEKSVGHGHDYVTIVTGVIERKPQVLYVGERKG